MRALASTFLCVVLAACGGHGTATSSDAPGGGDGGGGGGDGGMTTDAAGNDGGGSTGRDITVTLIDHPNDAASFAFLAAYQDGSAPWQLAPAPVGDTYEFTVHAPVWGFAYTCTEPAAVGTGTGTAEETRIVELAQFAVAERSSLTLAIPEACTDRIQRVVLTGTVANLAPGGATLAEFGSARSALVAPSTGMFRIETAPGTHDLLAVHGAGGGAVGGGLAADAIAIARGVAVTGATMHDLDFATAEAPQTFPVTVMTSNAASVTASTVLYTAGATSAGLVTSSSQPYTTASLAADQMAAGDRYAQVVTISSGGQTAILTNVTATPAAQTVGDPTALGGATSTVPTTTPYPEIATTWTSYAGAAGYVWTTSQQLPAAQCGTNAQAPCRIVWATLLSPGVLGAMPRYQMPDLSGLAGWSPTYELVSGVNATGYVEAETSSAGAVDFPPASPPPPGTQRVEVRAAYAATP